VAAGAGPQPDPSPTTAAAAAAAGSGGDGKLVFAHVFGCSTHHYLLREWLSAAGIDPDLDVRLCVVPPPQMAEHMRHGHLDGFCVGDPWNTLAERLGYGAVVAPTTDIVPNHPEKVLAVTRRWAADHGPAVVAIVKALLQACAWCDDRANHPRLAAMLADPRYIGLPADDLAAACGWTGRSA
jgi:ABC-type nitrate/sulfonate/bicarbonate transport system substrate-binding protein